MFPRVVHTFMRLHVSPEVTDGGVMSPAAVIFATVPRDLSLVCDRVGSLDRHGGMRRVLRHGPTAARIDVHVDFIVADRVVDIAAEQGHMSMNR